MISVILRTAARFLMTLLLLFSVFLLLRGHNEPGGGFIGGLVASAGFILYATAYDSDAARRALRIDPLAVAALGLLVASLSGIAAVLLGEPFLTGQWASLRLLGLDLELGTPLVFDVGVYLVVLGVVLAVLLTLEDE
jgi:multicomponent Na+:H+ antiporter subunit B